MKKKILVVDDDEIIHNIVRDLFEYKEFEVFAAFDAMSGMELSKEKRPDIIILDINMPRVSGCAMSTLLGESPETKDIPILFLTGYIDEDEATEIGHVMAGHTVLTKPFNLDELLAAVAKILNTEIK